MSAGVVIRDATPAESDAVLDLYEWLFDPPGSVPPGWNRDEARDRLLAAIDPAEENAAVLVAEADGRLVGLCSACLDIASVRFGPRVWVEDLVVDPQMRSRGVGEALMGSAMSWARRRGATHLELDSGDARLDAHRFYERLEPSWSGRQYAWWLGR